MAVLNCTLEELVFAEKPRVGKFFDKTGHTFERLTVLGYAGKDKHGHSLWYCDCTCGNMTVMPTGQLTSKNTKSCGCLRNKKNPIPMTTNMGCTKPEYTSYCAAKRRCNNKNSKQYKYYGAKGIQFRFKSFEEFMEEVGPRPNGARVSVDRIDPFGHYEKGNIRWSNPIQQANNRTNNRLLCIDGVTKTMAEWVGSGYGNDWARVRDRIDDSGWCAKCAVFTPVGQAPFDCCKNIPRKRSKRDRILVLDGKARTVAEWAKHQNVKDSVIRSRTERGWCDRCAILTPVNSAPSTCCKKTNPLCRKIILNGQEKTADQWAKIIAISSRAVRSRVDLGWCDKCIIETKSGDCPPLCSCASNNRVARVTLDGKTKRVAEWARETGLTSDLIFTRIERGWCNLHAITLAKGSRKQKDCADCNSH